MSPRARGLGPPLYLLPPATAIDRAPAHRHDVLAFVNSAPDTRLIRTEPLATAFRRLIGRGGGAALADHVPSGHPGLRAAIADTLSTTRGIPASPHEILVTNGRHAALALTARVLFAPGDVVAVEHLGCRRTWAAFRQAGARLISVPVDGSGLNVAALAALAGREPVRAVHVTAHSQYPTAVMLSAQRRQTLHALAHAHRFVIIEDEGDYELPYDGPPVQPIASIDGGRVVVHVGALPRVLAPGVCIGYVAASAEFVDRANALRHGGEGYGGQAMDAAVGELIAEGGLQRQLLAVRRHYRSRRDALLSALARTFGDRLRIDPPTAGPALWATVDASINVDAWEEVAPRFGVAFQAGRRFTFDGGTSQGMRLEFERLNEHEIEEGVARLARALPSQTWTGPAAGRPQKMRPQG